MEWVLPGGTPQATSEVGTSDQTDSGVTRCRSGGRSRVIHALNF